MSEQTFAPDFLFSRVTNVHFGVPFYVVYQFFDLVAPQVSLKSGSAKFIPLTMPESPSGAVGIGYGLAVFASSKVEFQVRGSQQASLPQSFSVFTKAPYDKAGLQWFSDYQGADQILRLFFPGPPGRHLPDPDASAAALTGSGNFIVDVTAQASRLGRGQITAQDVSRQGG